MSKEEDGQLDGIVYKGVLEKVARLGFNSKKLCVLSEKQFSYFSDQKAQGTLKAILLQDVQAVKRDHSSKNFQFEIITAQRTELFAAASLEQLEHWVRILQSAILSTRRNSQGSYPGFRKSALHKYEEVEIDQNKQPQVSDRHVLARKSAPVIINGYEEIDIEVGSNPKLVTGPPASKGKPGPPVYSLAKSVEDSKPIKEPRPPPATINNYETIDLDDGFSPKLVTKATEGAPQSSPQATTEKIPSKAPLSYELAKHVAGYTNTEDNKSPVYSEAVSEKRSDLYLQAKEAKLSQGEITNPPDSAGYSGVTRSVSDLYARVDKFKTYQTDKDNKGASYSSGAHVSPAKTDQHSEVTTQLKEMELYGDGKSTELNQYQNVLDDDVYDEACSNSYNNPRLLESSEISSTKVAGSNNNDRKVKNARLPISAYMPHKEQDGTTTEDTTTVCNAASVGQTEAAMGNEESKLASDTTPDINDLLANPISPPTPVPSLKYGPLKKDQAIQELEKCLSSQQINTYQYSFLSRESSDEAIHKLKSHLEKI